MKILTKSSVFKNGILKSKIWLLSLGLISTSLLQAQITVTATSGIIGPTSYTTLNSAFDAINLGTHQGAISVAVIGNTTEPATPSPLLASGMGSSLYSSISIMPSGGNFTISSDLSPATNRGMIELAGADNVTIDGDDLSTPGERNLSFVTATSATAGIAVIRLSSNSTTGLDGADNNTIKNCIITGSRNNATSTINSYGIQFSNGISTSSSSTGAYSSLNTIIKNNLITRCYYGINAIGNSVTYLNTGTQIIKNTIGSSTATDAVAFRGITVSYSSSAPSASSVLISENDIRTGFTAAPGNLSAIQIGAVNAGAIISKNSIHDCINTTSSVWGMYGIHIESATNNTSIDIKNNMIRDIAGFAVSSLGNQYGGSGIYVNQPATGLKINNNTIAQLGSTVIGSCILVTSSGANISQLQNNIFVNNVASTYSCAIYLTNPSIISTGTVNNNNYFVNPIGVFSYYGANVTNFANWKIATSKDANSFNVLPNFISSTDLHITPGVVSFLESGGASVASTGVSIDFDNDNRPGPTGSVHGGGTAPDIGADEFDGMLPPSAPVIDLISASPAGSCVATSHTISATITPGGNNLTSVVLNYSFNGTFQTPITMTGGSISVNSVWTAVIPIATPSNANVTWSVTVTDPIYVITSTGATYNDEPLTGVTASAIASPISICAGSATDLLAILESPFIGTIGTGTLTSTSSAISPFYGTYGGVKTQYIIRAAELTAAGLSAGNISSIGIKITSTGASLTDLALNADLTTLNALTSEIIDVPTNRFSTALFVPSVGINTFNFSSPIIWDGTSNIILSFCWSNNNTSNPASTITYTAAGFVSSNARYVDNKTSAEVCGYIGTATPSGWGGSSTTSSNRPNFTFNGMASINATSVIWTDNAMVTVGTTNPLTVNPTVSTTYTASITAFGCAVTPSPSVLVTVTAIPAAVTVANSTQCGAQIPSASVTSNTGATTPTFNWYTAPTGGTAVQSNTNTTFGDLVSSDTTFYVSEIDGISGCESPRTAISITVTPADDVLASTSDLSICLGDDFTLTASNANAVPVQSYTYSWLGTTGSGVETSQSGTSLIVTPIIAGTYTYDLTAIDGGCSNTNSVVVIVKALPVITNPAANPTTVCSGDTIFLSAETYGIGPNAIIPIGNGSLTTSNTYNSPFYLLYGGVKDQFIIRANELTAMGIVAGDINSIGIDVTNSGLNFNGFSIHIAQTANTVASTTFIPTASLTEVYTNPSLVLTPNSLNTFSFSAPLYWDGVSNIIVQTSWSNNNTGGSINSANVKYDNTSFVATAYYRADNQTPAAILSAATGSGTYSTRPKFTFSATATTNISNVMTWNWSPGTGLNTADTSVVIVNNTGTPMSQVYNVTLTDPITGCTSTASTAMVTINPAELAPVATNSIQCGEGVPTASVVGSGNSANTFEWYLISTGGTPITGESGSTLTTYSINTTTTFYVGETNGLCLSALTPVTVTVTPPPAATIAGTAVLCLNETSVLTATSPNDPNFTYSWNNGLGTGATVNASPTATTTYTVIATDNSGGINNGCSTTAQFTVVVNPLPVTSPIVSSSTEICIGDTVMLTSAVIGSSVTIGTGTTAPGSTSWPNPFSAWYGGTKHQMLYTAAELTAQGLTSGSTISKVGFNLATATGGACVDFTIRMKNTMSTTLSDFELGTTTVYGPLTFTPSTAGQVDFTLSASFVWDGISNVIVETVHNAGNSGNGSGTTAVASTTPTNMMYRRTKDGVAGGIPGFDALTTGTTQGASTTRTNVIFTTLDFPTWSPLTNIFIDAAGTIAYTGQDLNMVYVIPTSTSTYKATYTSGAGCTDFVSEQITVNALPIINAGTNQAVCIGDGVTLSGTGGASYLWDNSVVNNVSFNPVITNTYTVTGTDANGCVNTDEVVVTVNPLPIATVVNNGNATITSNVGVSYQWIDCASNLSISGATAQTFAPTSNGVYAVIVTNANNCSDTSACVYIGNVEIKGLTNQMISVYPNPTHDNIVVEFSMNKATIEIIDALGAVLEIKDVQSGDIVSLSTYNRGVYFIKVVSENGSTLHRIVKN